MEFPMAFLRGRHNWLRNLIAVLSGIFFSFACVELFVKALAVTGITPLGELISVIGNLRSGAGGAQGNFFELYDRAMLVIMLALLPITSFLTGGITGFLITSNVVI